MTHSLACATCLLFTALGFLFQLLAEPVLVALLNCENLSLIDCQTCCILSMPAVGCALLSSLFLRRETPVSHSAEGASGTMMLVPFFFADSSDRLARVIRAYCLLSRNGFALCLLRLYLWAVLQIAKSPLCSSCVTGCSLLPARIIRACFLLTRP